MHESLTFSAARPAPPTFREALIFWWKLGCISFGGPAGQIAIMHQELVEKRRWISEARFLHALNYCMLLPGPEAQQLASYIGWLLHGTRGGLTAGILFVAPSMCLLMLLSGLYLAFGKTSLLIGLLGGIKPAVLALVAFAAYRIAKKTLSHPLLWLIAVLAFLGLAQFNLAFPWIIGAAATAGAMLGKWYPSAVVPANHHIAIKASQQPSVIDDDSPIPDHAKFRALRFTTTVALFLIVLIGSYYLVHRLSTELGLVAAFFTKLALVTFGGAYAVLPYMVQGSVQEYQWLSANQMMDGLAMGETTPGPLIIIVTFVGYLGGVSKQVLGASHDVLNGIAGGLIATFFTFLPSFAFILAGGPLVESSRGNLRLHAVLTAITAAVVGVIASLAIHFGKLILLGTPPVSIHWGACLIAGVCLYALVRYQIGVIRLLAICAVAGLALQALSIP